MSYRTAIGAHPPWETRESPEEEPKELAPRQQVTYHCRKGHEMILPFAAGVEAPESWDCRRCGGAAYAGGVPQDGPVAMLPGYHPAGGYQHTPREDTSPPAQLYKRRTKAELEAILAEAMERVRQTGVAR